jgi:plasmid stability protein
MTALTIRGLDEALKTRLRLRAAARNRSMEEEVRQILKAALAEPALQGQDLGSRIRARFAGLGADAIRIEPREPMREPPDFSAEPKRSRTTRRPTGQPTDRR